MLLSHIGSVKVGARDSGGRGLKKNRHVDDEPSTAISKISTKPMHSIRDDLTEICTATLLGYRKNCAQASGASQVRQGVLAIVQFPDTASSPTPAGHPRSVQRACDIYSRDD